MTENNKIVSEMFFPAKKCSTHHCNKAHNMFYIM